MSVTGGSRIASARELDPLPLAVAGTVLAAAGAVAWPALQPAVLCLSVLVSWIVWIRTVNTVRNRHKTGYCLRRLAPLGATGVAGWSGIAAVGVFAPSGTVWALMVVAASLWPASRLAGVLP